MKILFLTKYMQQGASSRYRTYQYLGFLKAHGVDARVSPLFPGSYLDSRYHGRRLPVAHLAWAVAKRTARLLSASQYDVVVVEKELLPYFPALPERLLHLLNDRLVFDYDDAVFSNYEHNWLLKRKIPLVMRLGRAITVGNAYLADYASRWNTNVRVVPTAVPLGKYEQKESYALSKPRIVIGWIGTPITASYLSVVREALAELSRVHPIVLRCVGASSCFALSGVDVENIPWSERDEAAQIATFDLGIMPLRDDPFSRGKCGLKLLQYMAAGIPAIGSPVGANLQILRDGVNGFLVQDPGDWVKAIELLLGDAGLREAIGREGWRTVSENYSVAVVAPRLLAILAEVAGHRMGARAPE